MKKICLLFIFLLVIPSMSFAKKVMDIEMPETYAVAGKTLVLNGLGVRTVKIAFIGIKVYLGGFYMEEKSSNSADFLADGRDKFIIMHFLRDVSKEKLVDGWIKAFKACLGNTDSIKTQIDQFYSFMSDYKENDEFNIHFSKTGVEVFAKGKSQKIEGEEFSKSLLSVWFINAGDENLRDGLLGIKSL